MVCLQANWIVRLSGYTRQQSQNCHDFVIVLTC